MSWLRLDDKFAQHPKVAGLSDRAFRIHIETMVYCAAYDTKGRIPPAALRLSGATTKQTNELLDAGLWDKNGIGMVIHDFEDYNGERAMARERQRRFRSRHGNGDVTET
jgi:hypothetical protein